MEGERRFTDAEVARIIERAAAERVPAPGSPASASGSSGDGLTLAELQEIGREVGIAPARIAEAAAALDVRHAVPARRRQLGMPVSAGLVVDLPRLPDDREWEILVAELRRTFRATGRERSGRVVREWRNGNLYATIEPAEKGYRLVLGTFKSDAAAFNLLGIVGLVMAVFMLVSASSDAGGAIPLALLGVGMLVWNAIRLPRWAAERDEQMAHIAERALALLRPPASEEGAPEGA